MNDVSALANYKHMDRLATANLGVMAESASRIEQKWWVELLAASENVNMLSQLIPGCEQVSQ